MLHTRGPSRNTGLALALLLGLFLIVPSHASAQAVTGTLLGNVTDTTGAAVPGVTVTARRPDQRQPDRQTNETGLLHLSSLQNGTYAVEAELQGFKKVLREGVEVEVNTTVRVDLSSKSGQFERDLTSRHRHARC